MTAKSIDIRKEADEESVGEWTFGAFCVWPIALLIAYIRSPKMPNYLLAKLEKEELSHIEVATLEEVYVKRLKARQIKATWIGTAIAWTIAFCLIVFAGSALGAPTTGISGAVERSISQERRNGAALLELLDAGYLEGLTESKRPGSRPGERWTSRRPGPHLDQNVLARYAAVAPTSILSPSGGFFSDAARPGQRPVLLFGANVALENRD